jgi:hypothetical protein
MNKQADAAMIATLGVGHLRTFAGTELTDNMHWRDEH